MNLCRNFLDINADNCIEIEKLTGSPVKASKNPVYQVSPSKNTLTEGILLFDCYHFESVTYSPASKANTVIAENSIEIQTMTKLFTSVKTPWEDMFVNGLSGEPIKNATIQMAEDKAFEEQCFGGTINIGKGKLIFSQINTEINNNKIERLYSRLLANIGAKINTAILTYIKEEKDYGIVAFMALPYQTHNDYALEEAYFCDKNYILNNLGEGVYGWMKRV